MARSRSSSSRRRAVALALALCLGTSSLVWANYPILDNFTIVSFPATTCGVAAGVTAYNLTFTIGTGLNRSLMAMVFSSDDTTAGATSVSWKGVLLSVAPTVDEGSDSAGGTNAPFYRNHLYLTPLSGTGILRFEGLLVAKHYAFAALTLTGVDLPVLPTHDNQSQNASLTYQESFINQQNYSPPKLEANASHVAVTVDGTATAISPYSQMTKGLSAAAVLANFKICGMISQQVQVAWSPPTVSPYTWSNTITVNQSWASSSYTPQNKGGVVGPALLGSGQFLPLQGVGQ